MFDFLKLKELFLLENSDDLSFFNPHTSNRINEIILKFRKESNGILNDSEIDIIKNLINGNLNDKWFLLYSLRILENLPANLMTPILEILAPSSFDLPICDAVLANLDRIYGFVEIENSIQNLFTTARIPLVKKMISGLFYSHKIADDFSFVNNSIVIHRKCDYQWIESSYKTKFSSVTDQYYQVAVNEIFFNRYSIILKAYISEQENEDLKRALRLIFPRKELCPKKLYGLLARAKEF